MSKQTLWVVKKRSSIFLKKSSFWWRHHWWCHNGFEGGKMLFFDHLRIKNGQIWQSKPWELLKNGQQLFWKNLHFDDVITDDVIMDLRGVKCCFSIIYALKTDKYGKANLESCQRTVNNFFGKIFMLMTSSLMMS